MLHAVLVILVAPVLYALFVFCFPDKACECPGQCQRCKGTGRRFRRGARLVRAVALFLQLQRKPWRW
jgi:hypothetical protein